MELPQKRPDPGNMTLGKDMQGFLDQFPVQEVYETPSMPCKIERLDVPEKRSRGKGMQNVLDQFPVQETYEAPYKIENVLEQLEQDVTCIKTSLEKKRSKVTLSQVNDKVDQILNIIQKWNA